MLRASTNRFSAMMTPHRIGRPRRTEQETAILGAWRLIEEPPNFAAGSRDRQWLGLSEAYLSAWDPNRPPTFAGNRNRGALDGFFSRRYAGISLSQPQCLAGHGCRYGRRQPMVEQGPFAVRVRQPAGE